MLCQCCIISALKQVTLAADARLTNTVIDSALLVWIVSLELETRLILVQSAGDQAGLMSACSLGSRDVLCQNVLSDADAGPRPQHSCVGVLARILLSTRIALFLVC